MIIHARQIQLTKMRIRKTKKVLYVVSNIFFPPYCTHVFTPILRFSPLYHPYISFPLHPATPLLFAALHYTSLHFTTLFYTFRWFSLHFLSLYFSMIFRTFYFNFIYAQIGYQSQRNMQNHKQPVCIIPLLHSGEHVILSCMFVGGKEMITVFQWHWNDCSFFFNRGSGLTLVSPHHTCFLLFLPSPCSTPYPLPSPSP